MRSYEMGNQELDTAIKELIAMAGEGAHEDLIAEMITTALKLYRDSATRGDVKLFNAALKEMRYSSLVFSQYRDRMKVTIFGSARTKPHEPNYQLIERFARHMATERNWMVITGAGPGIMEAGNKGAGMDGSIGVNIRLPFEAEANDYIPDHRVVNFKYFFTRKLGFVKEAHAFVMAPGGFGTMDEVYEVLTLMQTGKTDLHPLVFIEAPGGDYWNRWNDFVESKLLAEGMIERDDLSLFCVTNDMMEAAEEICGFYRNYHSQRYVAGRLVIRIRYAPTTEQLAELNREFADIVTTGEIELVPASEAEVEDDDALDFHRLRFMFDRRHFGRLRQLIDRLNQIPVDGGTPPTPIPTAFNPDLPDEETDAESEPDA